jgi:hypothetical protein
MYFAWHNTTAVETKLLVRSDGPYISNVGGLDRQISLIHPQVVTVESVTAVDPVLEGCCVGLLILPSKANGDSVFECTVKADQSPASSA